jgi:hypothetical protein
MPSAVRLLRVGVGQPAYFAMNPRTCGYTCVRQRRPLKMP